MRVTIKAVNAALKAKGYDAEIVRGAGYFYFAGEDAPFRSSSVYVYHLSSYTAEEWVREFEELKKLDTVYA